MKLTIVIPCYNEEKNIPLILAKFNEIIKDEKLEVLLVDNGSTDKTQEVLKKLLPLYSFARTVKVDQNKGYGYGIITGLKNANGEFLGWTHADMQTDPKDIKKSYDILEKNNWDKNIFIKGKRKNRPFFDNFFSVGMSVFESILMRSFLYEINAQPTIFARDFFLKWDSPPYDFSLDLYSLYLAKLYKMNIIRFDVLFPERLYGESKWNTGLKSKWKFIKRTVNFSFELKKKGVK